MYKNWNLTLFSQNHRGYRGGGALNFFSGRGVRPGFPKCGACELTFASEKGGLWAENWACELKMSKFWGLWAKIWVKIEAVEATISKFSQKGILWTDSFAWNGTLASGRRGVKRGSGRTSHTPFLGQCPPGGYLKNHWTNTRLVCTHLHAFFELNPNIVMEIQIFWIFERVEKFWTVVCTRYP